MKILNLYAGIGGNRKLWGDEHEITAVENIPEIADIYKQLYPEDTVIVADAHQYLLDHFKEYDFIWSSPPCPTHSKLGLMNQKIHDHPKYFDPVLWQEIVFLKHHATGRTMWVVENVRPYYKPFIAPTAELTRHYFWSNFFIPRKYISKGYSGSHNHGLSQIGAEALSLAYGITLPDGVSDARKLLKNAVHPHVGLHIFESMNNLKQETLL